ncbi:MAG: hypothetical protein JWR59_2500 [Brevundimonas sp.]|nr:hypothetical protein [Brevundimonas sp.]
METAFSTHILGPRKKDSSNLPRIPRMLKTQQNTEEVANYLVDKFQSPEFENFFLKVAWRLDKGTIDRLVGTAFELGKNPRAYFITLVKKERQYHDNN